MTGTRTWFSGAGMLCLVMALVQAAATAEPEDAPGPLGEPTPWGRAVIEGDTLRLHIERWPEKSESTVSGRHCSRGQRRSNMDCVFSFDKL